MYATETQTLVTMPESLKQQVKDAAWRERVSANEYIRRVLAEKLGFPYQELGA